MFKESALYGVHSLKQTPSAAAALQKDVRSIACRAAMSIQQPLIFGPIFMERVWGGRRLESLFGKALPAGARIGESWEIVDRPEAQSVVAAGPLKGRTLHDLWSTHRAEIFGNAPEGARFPLLIKLLDAREKLSLQVHPPAAIAAELGGEAKTEFWYIADASPAAELYVGLRSGRSRAHFEKALKSNGVEECAYKIPVRTGDAMFLPSGRMHAVGAGNVIVEIMENSDTTYRVFDWNRRDNQGRPRELHIEQALRSIDFEDYEPKLVAQAGERLVTHSAFEVEKWNLSAARAVGPEGKFATVGCISGEIGCAGASIRPGEFFLLPASLQDRSLTPLAPQSVMLRVTIPD